MSLEIQRYLLPDRHLRTLVGVNVWAFINALCQIRPQSVALKVKEMPDERTDKLFHIIEAKGLGRNPPFDKKI